MSSSTAPVMMHVLVDEVQIVRGPGRDAWWDFAFDLGDSLMDDDTSTVKVDFIIRTDASTHTYRRSFDVSRIAFSRDESEVTFTIKFSGRELLGRQNTRTRAGLITPT